MNEVGPVGRAILGDVETEGLQQIQGVTRCKPARAEGRTQRRRNRLRGAAAQQARLEPVEMIEFFSLGQARVVGHVVGRTDEIVKSHDRRPVTRRDKVRGDGKIFVRMRFPRGNIGCSRHDGSSVGRPGPSPARRI